MNFFIPTVLAAERSVIEGLAEESGNDTEANKGNEDRLRTGSFFFVPFVFFC